MLLIHVVVARLYHRVPPQLAAAGAALAGSVPTMLLGRLLVVHAGSVPSPVDVTYGALVYGCLAYSYFHVFNMSETARRIRILSELYLAGPLTGREISRLYRGEGLLEARLDRLVATRLLDLRDGRYVRVSRLFYASAWLIRGWRTILAFDRHRAAGSGA